jgi:hypothetical protein
MLSCQKEVDAQEKAAVVAVQDFTMCGGCGGWVVNVDNASFRAELPAEFTRPDTAVWLRYEKDESSEQKKAGNWIRILSIRERLP